MVIRRCDPGDAEPGKDVCLYTRDGKRLLGRHEDRQGAHIQEAAIKRAQARRNPAGDLKASPADLRAAVDHATQWRMTDWDVDDFRVIPMGKMTVRGLERYADGDDFSSWLEVDPRDFEGLSREERLEELQGFRSAERWAEQIPRWLDEGIPPVVIIEAPVYEEGQLVKIVGDGRGRINMATALGIKLPVVVMRWRGRKNPRSDDLPAIYIYSRPETDELFRLKRTGNVLAMISIGDRDQGDPWFLEEACEQGIEVLRLEFDDVDEGDRNAPDEEDVQYIVDFIREMLPRLEQESGILLIHCEAGISRSGASAALAWMMALPEASPEEVAALLLEDRPGVWPNAFMLEMGAPLVGKDDEYVHAVLGEVAAKAPSWESEENPAPRTRYQDVRTGTDHADILAAFFTAIENTDKEHNYGGIAVYRDVDGDEEYPGGIDFRVWLSGDFSFDPPAWSGYFVSEARYASGAVYLDWKDALMAKMQQDRAWQSGGPVEIYSGAYSAGRNVAAHGKLRLASWDWFVDDDFSMYTSEEDLIAELAAAIDAYPVPEMVSWMEARDLGYKARAFRYGSDF